MIRKIFITLALILNYMKKLSILGFEETPGVFKRFSQMTAKKSISMSIALAIAFILALTSFVIALVQP